MDIEVKNQKLVTSLLSEGYELINNKFFDNTITYALGKENNDEIDVKVVKDGTKIDIGTWPLNKLDTIISSIKKITT